MTRAHVTDHINARTSYKAEGVGLSQVKLKSRVFFSRLFSFTHHKPGKQREKRWSLASKVPARFRGFSPRGKKQNLLSRRHDVAIDPRCAHFVNKRNKTTEIYHIWNDKTSFGRLFGLYSNVCDNVIITLTIIIILYYCRCRKQWSPHDLTAFPDTIEHRVWLTKQSVSESANSVVWKAKTVSGCWIFF